MKLEDVILLILRTSIALIVFSLGLAATVADPLYLFRRPIKLARAFLSMNVVMPALAILLVFQFDLDPAVKIALGTLSLSPVPPIFPKTALKEGGAENYTIGLLVATSVLAIAVIPLGMAIFGRITGVPLSMNAGTVAAKVFEIVLLPLLLGILLRRLAPAFAQTGAKHIGRLANLLMILGVLPVLFVQSRTILSLFGNGTLLSLAAFALIGLFAGYWLGGPEAANRRVLALATALRHPGLAVAMAHANFPQQKLALPAVCLYVIISVILSVPFHRFLVRVGAASTDASRPRAAA